jgi:hypothetical protein
MKKYFPVILLLAAFTLSACGLEKTKNEGASTVNEDKVEVNESKKSLKELLGLGSSQKCTYEINQDGENMKGEIIVSGKKFKQMTEITNDQGSMKVYAISDGTYYYSWSDAMKGNGTKMKIDDIEKDSGKVEEIDVKEEGKPGEAEQKMISMDEKIDYKCTAATLNDSDLALPTDVKFVDYTEMMKGFQNGNIEELKKLIPSEGE